MIEKNNVFYWIALGTALILLIPLIAMQFNTEISWDLTDFIVMGTLLFGTSSAFVLVARKTNRKYRAMVGIAFLFAFFWLWAELAVGVFTNWGS